MRPLKPKNKAALALGLSTISGELLCAETLLSNLSLGSSKSLFKEYNLIILIILKNLAKPTTKFILKRQALGKLRYTVYQQYIGINTLVINPKLKDVFLKKLSFVQKQNCSTNDSEA